MQFDIEGLSPWFRLYQWTGAETAAILAKFIPPFISRDQAHLVNGYPNWLETSHHSDYQKALNWLVNARGVYHRQEPLKSAVDPFSLMGLLYDTAEADVLPGAKLLKLAFEQQTAWPKHGDILNLKRWLSVEVWTLNQAAHILCGLEPFDKSLTPCQRRIGKPNRRSSAIQHEHTRTKDLLLAAIQAGSIPIQSIEPGPMKLNPKGGYSVSVGDSNFPKVSTAKLQERLNDDFHFIMPRDDVLQWALRQGRQGLEPSLSGRLLEWAEQIGQAATNKQQSESPIPSGHEARKESHAQVRETYLKVAIGLIDQHPGVFTKSNIGVKKAAWLNMQKLAGHCAKALKEGVGQKSMHISEDTIRKHLNDTRSWLKKGTYDPSSLKK